MTCNVSGILSDPNGLPITNQLVQFLRIPLEFSGSGGLTIAGGSVGTTTSAVGALSVDLVPGYYVVSCRWAGGSIQQTIAVPEAASAGLADLAGQVLAPLTPSMVQQALDARDASEAAAALALAGSPYRFTNFQELATRLKYSGATGNQIDVVAGNVVDVVGLGAFRVLPAIATDASEDYTATGGVKLIFAGEVEAKIFTSDWQPQNAAQVTQLRGVLTEMAAFVASYDRKVSGIIHAGDVVDEASQDVTGAPPFYGYEDLAVDMAIRRLPKMKAIPGNHDRDGTGDNLHERNWSYETFKRNWGPLFFAYKSNGVLYVCLGDMSGSTGGEQSQAGLEWFEQTLASSEGENVIVVLHQPIYGTYGASVADYNSNGFPASNLDISAAYQQFSQRISAAIAARDNIAAVFFGHVGASGYASSTEINTQFGTTHINIQMALEAVNRLENGGAIANWPNHYAVVDFNHGSLSAIMRRRDAKTGDWIGGSEHVITFKYPINLFKEEFDTQISAAAKNAFIAKQLTIHEDLSADRVEGPPGTWETRPGVRRMLNLKLEEVALDGSAAGHGPSLTYYVPGSVTQTGTDGTTIAANPGSAFGGSIDVVRVSSSDANTETNMNLSAADPTQGAGAAALKLILQLLGGDGTVFMPGGWSPISLGSADDIDSLTGVYTGARMQVFAWSDDVPINAPFNFGFMIEVQTSNLSRAQLILRRNGTNQIVYRNFTLGAWRAFVDVLTTLSVLPGPFANDAAAAATVGVGQMYRNTSGAVSWRVA